MNEIDLEDITKENGLLDIYKVIYLKLPKSRINIYSTLGVSVLLSVYAIRSSTSSIFLLDRAREWAELGFSFSTGILGFLIAGFTVFATVSDKSLFVEMARITHRRSNLSYLKYNFFSLMYVFIVYLGFALLCLLILLLGGTSGFISMITYLVVGEHGFSFVKRCFAGMSIVVIGTWFFYSLMLLQSFIFNVYHIVMTAIRWEMEKVNNRN